MDLPSSFATVFLLLAGSVSGLELRDEVNTTDNVRFQGFPNATQANPDFGYSQFEASGVGYYVQDTRRQFALVSPRHFVCASHFRPRNDGQVSFLGTDGVVRTYEILRTEIIAGSDGENTDLTLGTLEEEVDASVIHPLAYANLGSDAAYAGPGLVFGNRVRVGNTTFGGVTTTGGMALTGSQEVDSTRMINLLYSNGGFDGDDALLRGGDSGSPAFLALNGELALVGTNSVVIDNLTGQVGLAAFVPFYVDELNALMADEGYQMRESMPAVTTLTAEGASGGTLRQAFAGEWSLTIANEGLARANNLNVSFSGFTQAPDEAAGPDFFGESDTGADFQRHSAFLEDGESTTLSLNWNAFPAQETIAFQVEVTSDEGAVASFAVELTLLPSFRQFVSGLKLQGAGDDEDGDGVVNLLEYALGGDVSSPSLRTPEGSPLGLEVSALGEEVEVSYLRRTDSLERGLAYELLQSVDLSNWEQASSDEVRMSEVAEEGFQKISMIQNSPEPRRFFILRVTLDEDPAE